MSPMEMTFYLALMLGRPSHQPIRIFGWLHYNMTPAHVEQIAYGCRVGGQLGEPNYVKFLMEKKNLTSRR